MRDPDDGLRALFVRHLPPPRHLQAVELGMTSRGVPDLYFCLDGVTGWMEFKATRHWAVTLRPGQVGWLVTHCRHGGKAVIAVRRRTSPARQGRSPPRLRGGDALRAEDVVDELYLLRAQFAAELRAGGLRWALTARDPEEVTGGPHVAGPDPVLGSWGGGPRRWDWAAVRALLVGEAGVMDC